MEQQSAGDATAGGPAAAAHPTAASSAGQRVAPVRVAWFHAPKTGTAFGSALARYANRSLPAAAQVDTGGACRPEVCDPTRPMKQCVKCHPGTVHSITNFAYKCAG